MDTENGVLELWSNGGTRNGVKEYRSHRVATDNEDFLIFELRFLIRSEEESRICERTGKEVSLSEQRRFGRRVNLGIGGKMAGRRSGFAHLFPDNSTQVVDFPHLMKVSQAKLGTNMGKSRNAIAQNRRGRTKNDLEMEPAVRVEKGVSEYHWKRVLAENGCAQLHAFTRNYTYLHKVIWSTLRAAKSEASRQDLPIRELIHRVSRCRGAAFRRLLPASAAFSHGGGAKMPKYEMGCRGEVDGSEQDWLCKTGMDNDKD
jgi:hypothetical protein